MMVQLPPSLRALPSAMHAQNVDITSIYMGPGHTTDEGTQLLTTKLKLTALLPLIGSVYVAVPEPSPTASEGSEAADDADTGAVVWCWWCLVFESAHVH